jgi:hypothetical protein
MLYMPLSRSARRERVDQQAEPRWSAMIAPPTTGNARSHLM